MASYLDFEKNIDEKDIDAKDILSFYEYLSKSSLNLCDVLESKQVSAYKKAYKYLKEHNIETAKIEFVDIETEDINRNIKINIDDNLNLAKNWNVAFFDKQCNFIRADVATKAENRRTENIKTDTRNVEFQTETQKSVEVENRDMLINSLKKISDSNGKLLYTEKYETSSDVANKFDIIREYPDGKKYKIGLAEVSNAGDIIIEKSLVSETGVKTDYNYLETPNGSILSNTKITDKNGKVIFNNNYQYKVIDDNHYSTVENGVKYDIQFKENEVTVTRDDGKSVSISLGDNSVDSSDAVLSKDLLPILKKMPASFYFDMKEYGLKKIGLEIDDVEENNAHYSYEKNLIAVSKGNSDATFVLAHEFGHYRDEFLKVSSDPDVINTYMKERKALIENQSQFEAIQLNYFIDAYCRRTSSIKGSIQEITAEINGFLYTSNIKSYRELRGQYLQQYFPKTFAKIADKLTNCNKGKVEVTMNNSVAASHVYNAQEPVKKYVKPETNVDLTPEAKAQVKDAVQNIRNNYRASFDQIKADLKAMGLDDIGNMSIRLKGEQSLYDKIANYMLEHKGATLEDAIKDVRDAIGARTVVESGKFANHPEVKALLDAGKEREAMLRAAELQSEPAVESLKSEILKQEQNNNHLVTARISNYVSPDGIPYLSENQLADLKQFAANHGVKLKINLRIDPSDPNFSKIDENYKPTTKSQPSGYTALQVNFITKDGKIIEWQFRGDKVNEFAEGEHIPYDLRTGKNIIGEHKELEELYNPFIDMLSEKNMNKETYKEYNRYLSDYYTHLRKLELGFDSVEPKLEDYGKGFKFDERLSAKNLIVLHETAEKIKNKVLSVKDAINEYNSKININRIEKFAGSVQPYTNFVVQNQEKIKELNKIQDMEEFCKQSFELIKNEMGLKDSGVKLAFAKGNEGGYYDLESNTVYVNTNWNGTKCVEGQGNKAEIFGDIAHELTHHIQWIEIMRNGWFEDDLGSAYKQQLLKSKEGKYIYNYASKIGSNDNSFETSMSQLWNWLNYKEPYKKGQNGFVSDRNGNPIVDENSSEYKEYINQPVEKDAFEKGKAVVKKYKELID